MTVLEYIEELDEDDLEINIISDEQLSENADNPILIISRELAVSDTTSQLVNLVICLKEMGYYPFIYTENGGDAVYELLQNNVLVINANGKARSAKWMDKVAELFEIVFANTLHVEPYVSYLAPKVSRLYWWIHEDSYWFMENICTEITDVPSLYILASGIMVKENIKRFMKRDSEVLNICCDRENRLETSEGNVNNTNIESNRKAFLWTGVLDSNKAVDVFLNAVITMSAEYLLGADYYIIAPKDSKNQYSQLIDTVASKVNSIHYIDLLPKEEMSFYMKKMDAVVVTSMEETVNISAIEGLMKNKVLICSDGCSVSRYLTDGDDAFIFKAGDYEQLREKMIYVIEHGNEAGSVRAAGKNIYDKYFSKEVFKTELKRIFHNTSLINNNMNKCSGCGACHLSCPVKAITMKKKKGFVYPEVDFTKCVNCGKCRHVCPVENVVAAGNEILAYAFRIGNDEKRMESQSGGAFTAMAEQIISEGGLVYGVSLCEDLVARYIEIESAQELKKIKKSKYVQAVTGDIFVKVKERLAEGRKILFGGTSCHINGLINYIGADKTENLYTCDLICHGVPSPDLFAGYIDFISKNGKIDNFLFRDKKPYGWRAHYESWDTDKENVIDKYYTDIFYSHLAFRESCYVCPYAKYDKPADVTIGDFWGIENVLPQIDDNRGVSVVLARTEKGKDLAAKLKGVGILASVSKESCMQANLAGPSSRPYFTDKFWDAFYEIPFSGLYSGYVKGQYYNFNEEVLNVIDKSDFVAKVILDYAESHSLKIDAVCGNWKMVVPFVNRLIAMEKEVPCVIDVFGRNMEFIHFKPVSVSEYMNTRKDETGVVLVLDMNCLIAYAEVLINKGISAGNILPASFIIDGEA